MLKPEGKARGINLYGPGREAALVLLGDKRNPTDLRRALTRIGTIDDNEGHLQIVTDETLGLSSGEFAQLAVLRAFGNGVGEMSVQAVARCDEHVQARVHQAMRCYWFPSERAA